MPTLQPLLAPNRYSDEEWKYAISGLCGWETANYPSLRRCGRASDPKSFYRWCAEHDARSRRDDPGAYGR